MMRAAALLCLTLMSALILSWGLPQLYDMALLKSLDKTHAFFSPVLKKFIYTEQVHGEDEKAAQKSDGHHADIVYKDEDGGYHDRLGIRGGPALHLFPQHGGPRAAPRPP